MKNEREKVSSDGIAGARLCGILFSAVLFVFILGIYVYQIANIIMVSSGIIILIMERKKIEDFFFNNCWENRFWMVYIGCIFIIGGVFSVLFLQFFLLSAVNSHFITLSEYSVCEYIFLFCMIIYATLVYFLENKKSEKI